MALAVAPYIPSYTSRSPYLTTQEYLTSPTAVDTTSLGSTAASGNTAAQTAALAVAIARASSWADSICHQVLAATSDTDPVRRYRVNRWGNVRVPLRYRPVLEIDAVTVGMTPSTMAALDSNDAADIAFIGTSVVEIPVLGLTPPTSALSYYGSGGITLNSWPLVQVTYVNGWPNTTLATSPGQPSTTWTVASALGIYPGTQLTFYDGMNTELATVASVTGNTVTLTAATAYNHPTGCSVSALPPAVKQAVVCLTSVIIKTRGSEAVEMEAGPEGTPSKEEAAEAGAVEDMGEAVDLLTEFIRTV